MEASKWKAQSFLQQPAVIGTDDSAPLTTVAEDSTRSPTSSPPTKKVTFAELLPSSKTKPVPRLFTQIVCVLHTASRQNRPMPVSVNNSLPSFNLRLGQHAGGCVDLGTLFDSCAAVSSGYKLFHWYLMSEYPEVVHSYEEFNDANPFEPIKLAGAIRDPANLTADICGELTAVIHYFTPFYCSDGSPCVIAFTLSDSVNVNTILGWPTIAHLGMNLLVTDNAIHSTVLNHSFSLSPAEPRLGLPPNVIFNPATFQ